MSSANGLREELRRTVSVGIRTRGAAVVAALIALAAAVFLPASAAHATVGVNDYPYATSGVDQPDPWGFLTRECTSFVAWRLNHDAGVAFTNWYRGVTWGDADNWASAARAAGVPVDSNPTPGSVAQFPPGVDGAENLGHVAYVMSVGAGTVTVEDYNYKDAYDGGTPFNYSQHTVSTSGLNFIHFTSGGGGGPYVTGTVEANPTLNVRSGPGTGYPIVGTIGYLSRTNISCYSRGTTVTATWPDGSTWTTNVWDGLRDNSTGQFNGTYVSDAWVDTQGDTSTMVPHC